MNISQYLEVPDPIDWRQGMLLSPQHFQQQELHVDRLTTHKLYISQPHYWGLIDIRLDRDDLAQGRISISRLYAVLPDGEVIDFTQGETDSPLEASVDANELGDMDEGELITVSIGAVRRGVSNGGSVGRLQKRYEVIEYDDITDENNTDQRVDLKKKKLLLKLFATNAVPNRYICLPLFKLLRRQDNSFELSSYHPAMLDARVSEKLFAEKSLWSRLELLLRDMRKKASSLAATQLVEAADRSTIAALIGRLPCLEVLLNTRMTHPFQLYMSFVDMVAGFMTVEYVNDFFVPRGYDHDNPAPGFTEHLDKLVKQIASIQLAFESFPFLEVDPGVFQIELPKTLTATEIVIALVPQQGQDPRILSSWLNSALVGSVDAFDKLRRQRVLGGKRRTMSGQERIEKSLPVRGNIWVLSNESYDFEGTQYNCIEEGQKLCIQGKSNHAPAAIYVYVRPGQKQQTDAAKAAKD